ncbi:MAG: hypothetical protein AAFU67_10830, partial [Bacteroidota bacterium]
MRSLILFFYLLINTHLIAQEVNTLIPFSSATYEAISWSEDGRIYTPDFVNGHILSIHLDGAKDTLVIDLEGPLGGTFGPNGNFYYSE